MGFVLFSAASQPAPEFNRKVLKSSSSADPFVLPDPFVQLFSPRLPQIFRNRVELRAPKVSNKVRNRLAGWRKPLALRTVFQFMYGIFNAVQGGFFSRKKPLRGGGFALQQLENRCSPAALCGEAAC